MEISVPAISFPIFVFLFLKSVRDHTSKIISEDLSPLSKGSSSEKLEKGGWWCLGDTFTL